MTATSAKAAKLVILFGFLGFACGLLNSWLRVRSAANGSAVDELPFTAGSFGVALFLGAFIAHRCGWLDRRPSIGISLAVIVWLTATYFAAIFLFFEVGHLLDVLLS